MYLRLAFSVAINMQPSMLLADEILAVGDLAFQERCLQKRARAGARHRADRAVRLARHGGGVAHLRSRDLGQGRDAASGRRAGRRGDRVPERDVGAADVGGEARGTKAAVTRGGTARSSTSSCCRPTAARSDRRRAPRTSSCASGSAPIARRRKRVARSICSPRACWCSDRRSPSWCRSVPTCAYEAAGQDSGEPAVRDDLHDQRWRHADSRRRRGARACRQQGARLHGLSREQR